MIRILTSVALAITVVTLVACAAKGGAAGGGAPPLTQVGVATPIAMQLPATAELTGSIEALQTVELRPRVGGIIQKVLVEDGAAVAAGQILFQLDEAPLRSALAHAQADLAGAQSRLQMSHQHYQRLQGLVAEKIVSQQAYDDAEDAVSADTAAVEGAKASLTDAQLNLGYATVTAPMAGRLGKVLTNAGNLAQANATLLVTLVSTDPVYVTCDLDETTWRTVSERLRASADGRGRGACAVKVGVALPGEQGYPHLGAVAFVDNQIDSASGSIRIRALLPNADGALTPGAFARVQLETEAPRPVLLINEQVVLAQLTTRYVLVVDDKGITSFRPVQLGATFGALRIVTSGLGASDRIAVNNLAKIFFPGMPVAPVPALMETTENVADVQPAAAPLGAAVAVQGKAAAANEADGK